MFNLLNNISKEDFLAHYWEKKPLVIRGALNSDQAKNIARVEDLITMASDNYYETRCISKNENQWTVEQGPFNPEKFENKNKFWTLIAHNINLYFPKGRLLEKAVEFIPKWLFDDVMCTYSTKGSSVGAHIDNYNVFILQAEGKRSWEIQLSPNKEFQEDLDVKILKEFKADETYILESGDMIYIPPHVAHAGLSLSESLSFSIGFKSLEDKVMLDSLAADLIENFKSEDFHRTSFTKPQNDPHQVSSEMNQILKDRLIKKISQEHFFDTWLTKFLSHSKSFIPTEDNTDIEIEEFKELLAQMPLARDEHTRLVVNKDLTSISINGVSYQTSQEELEFIREVFALGPNTPLDKDKSQVITDFVYLLFKEGFFYFQEQS